MVVLEGANNKMPMLTIGNTQYLQPDYLSPNPTMVRILIKIFFFMTINGIDFFFCRNSSWTQRKAHWHSWLKLARKSALIRATSNRSSHQWKKVKKRIRKVNRSRRQTHKKWIKLTSWCLSHTRWMCWVGRMAMMFIGHYRKQVVSMRTWVMKVINQIQRRK